MTIMAITRDTTTTRYHIYRVQLQFAVSVTTVVTPPQHSNTTYVLSNTILEDTTKAFPSTTIINSHRR